MSQETAALLTELVTSGTMPSRRNLRSWWDRTKKRMGLEDDQDFVFHTCRHTRATRMVDAGINIFVIKERSEEHTSELQSLMRNSYAVFCLKKKKIYINIDTE